MDNNERIVLFFWGRRLGVQVSLCPRLAPAIYTFARALHDVPVKKTESTGVRAVAVQYSGGLDSRPFSFMWVHAFHIDGGANAGLNCNDRRKSGRGFNGEADNERIISRVD